VLEWLAELGAVELAEDHEVTLPQLAPHHWQQLHSSNPMTMKPKLDRWGTCGSCRRIVCDHQVGPCAPCRHCGQ
jgi:hypothetical protein